LEPALGLVEGAETLELVGVLDAGPVVPKPEGETAGLVEIGFDDADPDPVTEADLLALDADLEAEDDGRGTPVTVVDWVAETAPMEKDALVANTLLMLEMSTNSMV